MSKPPEPKGPGTRRPLRIASTPPCPPVLPFPKPAPIITAVNICGVPHDLFVIPFDTWCDMPNRPPGMTSQCGEFVSYAVMTAVPAKTSLLQIYG